MAECGGRSCSSCGEAGCADRSAPQESGLKLHEGSEIGKTIAIASGKGGVGKSLTTCLLACGLASRGHKVGILDGDITGPSIPRSFGIHEPLNVDEESVLRPAVAGNGVKLVSTNMLTPDEATPFLWRGPVLNGILTQFYGDICWGELDYLLVDMPPGTGDIPMTVFQQFPLDGVVIATAPQVLVNMIVEKAMRMAAAMEVPVVGLVENMSYFECPDCGARHEIFGSSAVEGIAADKGVGAWARIPIDPHIVELVDAGKVEQVEGAWLDPLVDMLESL